MTGGFYGIHWGQRAEIVFFHLRLSCEIVISKNAIASPSRFINSICLIKEINHCVNWKYVNKHPRRVPKAASSAANREWAEKNVRKARWISVMNYLRNNELSCSRAIHFRNIFRPPQWQISILAFPIWELALISHQMFYIHYQNRFYGFYAAVHEQALGNVKRNACAIFQRVEKNESIRILYLNLTLMEK